MVDDHIVEFGIDIKILSNVSIFVVNNHKYLAKNISIKKVNFVYESC